MRKALLASEVLVSIGVFLRAGDAGKMAQQSKCQKLSIARLFASKLFADFSSGGHGGVPAHAISDTELFSFKRFDIDPVPSVRRHFQNDAVDKVSWLSDVPF